MQDQLPDDKAARVDWVIHAGTNAQMRERYDTWAATYDADIGSYEDYRAPFHMVETAREHLSRDEVILDSGAGTGLVGHLLRQAGYENLIALDYSAKMLEVARSKAIYKELHECDVSCATTLPENMADALVTCGSTTQIPSSALREYVRLVRPRGKILFAAIADLWVEYGYADVFDDLHALGKIVKLEESEPFQMMPTTEPEFVCEIWSFEVQG